MGFLRNYSPFLAVCMLALLALLVVPQELWHEHAGSVGPVEHSEGPGYVQTDDDCALCDFQLLPYSIDLTAFPSAHNPLPVDLIQLGSSTLLLVHIDTYAGRAPPFKQA